MPLFIPATWGSYGLVINADAYAEPLMKASVGTKTPIVTTNPIEYSSNDLRTAEMDKLVGHINQLVNFGLYP